MKNDTHCIVYNAPSLDARDEGIYTYVRYLLGAIGGEVDAQLVAAVRPSSLAELHMGVDMLLNRESRSDTGTDRSHRIWLKRPGARIGY
jgi:hypothetical protein